MKYLQTYDRYSEGIKSKIAGIGLTSLLMGSPEVKSQSLTPTNIQAEKDGVISIKNTADKISDIRNKENISKDKELLSLLEEIKSNINSNDQEKFKELYSKLSSHIENKYNYEIEQKDLSELSSAGISEKSKGMSLFEILGWLGSICLAICGIPQAWQSYKDKHSHGISWGFVLLWAFGEIFALAYVYDKLDFPLLLNYATNILILAVILYYKIKPQTLDYDKEVRRFH